MKRAKVRIVGAGLIAVLLAIGGIVYAHSFANPQADPQNATFVCPVTGEQLPCPLCCPLNKGD